LLKYFSIDEQITSDEVANPVWIISNLNAAFNYAAIESLPDLLLNSITEKKGLNGLVIIYTSTRSP